MARGPIPRAHYNGADKERECRICKRKKMESFLREGICDLCFQQQVQLPSPRTRGPRITFAEVHFHVQCEQCKRWLKPQFEAWFAAKCQSCWPVQYAAKWLQTWHKWTKR